MKITWKICVAFILIGYVIDILLKPIKENLSAYFYYPLEFIVYLSSCQLYLNYLEKKGK